MRVPPTRQSPSWLIVSPPTTDPNPGYYYSQERQMYGAWEYANPSLEPVTTQMEHSMGGSIHYHYRVINDPTPVQSLAEIVRSTVSYGSAWLRGTKTQSTRDGASIGCNYDSPSFDPSTLMGEVAHVIPPRASEVTSPSSSPDSYGPRTPSRISDDIQTLRVLSEWLYHHVYNTILEEPISESQIVSDKATTLARIQFILAAAPCTVSTHFLALWFISRLPVSRLKLPCEPTLVSFRETLYEGADTWDDLVIRTLVIGILLADKWLNDNAYGARGWYEVSNLPIRYVIQLEISALNVLDHNIGVSPEVYDQWMNELQRYHAGLIVRDVQSYTTIRNLLVRSTPTNFGTFHPHSGCYMVPLSFLPWCPEEDEIVSTSKRTLGTAPGFGSRTVYPPLFNQDLFAWHKPF